MDEEVEVEGVASIVSSTGTNVSSTSRTIWLYARRTRACWATPHVSVGLSRHPELELAKQATWPVSGRPMTGSGLCRAGPKSLKFKRAII